MFNLAIPIENGLFTDTGPPEGGAAGWRKHLEFPAGGDQRVKAKNGVREMLTGMRNVMITLIFQNTHCFEGKKRPVRGSVGGLYKRLRYPVALPSGGCLRIYFAGQIENR